MIAKVRGYSSTLLEDSNTIISLLRATFPSISYRDANFYERLARKVSTQLISQDSDLPEMERVIKLASLWGKPVSCSNARSFRDQLLSKLHADILTDIDAHVAKSMSLSYEVNRDEMIPR